MSSPKSNADEQMLKPFTIRRLSGLVQIAPEEYESTVTANPEAALTYPDEDDGEKITWKYTFSVETFTPEPTKLHSLLQSEIYFNQTDASSQVGSSFEMGQRLEEPGNSVFKLKGEPLHIFDIRRASKAGSVWVNFRDRTRQRASESQNRVVVSDKGQPLPTSKSLDCQDKMKNDQENWLRACRSLQAYGMAGSAEAKPASSYVEIGRTQTAFQNRASRKLTEEGQRQAREAGARFNWRPSVQSSNSFTSPSAAENRWASYSSGSKSSDPPKISRPVLDTKKEKSLLESFDEELAKMMQGSANDGDPPLSTPDDATASKPEPKKAPEDEHQNDYEAAKATLTGPGAVVFDIVSALAGGLQVLGEELTKKLPDIEQGIAKAQQDIPQAVNDTIGNAFNDAKSSAQDATDSVRNSPAAMEDVVNKFHESAFDAAEGLFKGFGELIGSISDVGKTILHDGDVNFAQVQQSGAGGLQQESKSSNKSTVHPSAPGDLHPPPVPAKRPVVQPKADVTRESESCQNGCIIGKNRAHVQCVIKDLPMLRHPLSYSSSPGDSHFRTRESAQGPETSAETRTRSRSPAPSQRARIPLETNSRDPKHPNDAALKPGTILDQEDADPDFAVRFPSLLSSPHHQAAKTVRFGASGSDSFLNDLNPESEIARFPTLSQLNRPNTAGVQDARPCTTNISASVEPTVHVSDSCQINRIPGSWPLQEAENPPSEAQTSGQFFDRMTGRSSNNLFRSKSITALNPAARLPGPFDPLSDLAHTMREQDRRHRNLRRAGTERIPSALRRPYSERFTGEGRVPWDNFLQNGSRGQQPRPARLARTEGNGYRRPRPVTEIEPLRPIFFGQNPETQPQLLPQPQWTRNPSWRSTTETRPTTRTVDTAPLSLAAEIARPQKDKFDICAEKLRDMGYGTWDRVEKERLRVIAVAAGGDVEEAVTVLEEEREAGKAGGFF
ncbi:MAG: hypothetical protein Q9227_006839 [Pyrenula ochraceoflavens]